MSKITIHMKTLVFIFGLGIFIGTLIGIFGF